MPQLLTYLRETASQTAGPYVHIGLAPGAAGFEIFHNRIGEDIVGPESRGERIRITGSVHDATGATLKDVLIEVWQANAAGIYPHPEDPRASEVETDFRGWGRVIPDFDTGEFAFDTIKPGAVPGPKGTMQAPHLNLWIVARGINIGLQTRAYFEDETEANTADPVLGLIEQVQRRETLMARKVEGGYRFEIHLQGDRETVFFDV